MKALCLTVVIPVSDLERSRRYYIDILGFQSDFVFGDYSGLHYDEVSVYLSGPDNDGIKREPGSALFCIACDEVDAYFELVAKKGAIVSGPPGDRIYGIRDFVVNDPDGNTLVFGAEIVK